MIEKELVLNKVFVEY